MHSFSIIVLGHPRYDKLARWRPSTITSQKSRYITQYPKQMPFFTSNQNIFFFEWVIFSWTTFFRLKFPALSVTQPESAYHIWCTLHHVTSHIETRHTIPLKFNNSLFGAFYNEHVSIYLLSIRNKCVHLKMILSWFCLRFTPSKSYLSTTENQNSVICHLNLTAAITREMCKGEIRIHNNH